jgi:YD repeat-containing protein
MSKSLDSVLIERAIALVESGWTQNAMARDKQGRIVCVRDQNER